MTLVVLAAGMGSRYGGLKQIDKVDDAGHIIIDYSIFDAVRAGFRDFTFIIKKEIDCDNSLNFTSGTYSCPIGHSCEQ